MILLETAQGFLRLQIFPFKEVLLDAELTLRLRYILMSRCIISRPHRFARFGFHGI